MICLSRNALPEKLSDRVATKRQELAAVLQAGTDLPESLANWYRDAALKEHLMAETHGKCAYCETMITHAFYGEVEHILPKSKRRDISLEPANLTIACSLCNNSKSDYYDTAMPLINPYTDDTDNQFIIFGALLFARPNCDRATLTILTCDLNRTGLCERRLERIQRLAHLADRYMRAQAGPLKDALLAELYQEAAPTKEYTFFVRAYLSDACSILL